MFTEPGYDPNPYKIYRRANIDEPWTLIAELPESATSFTDTNVVVGQRYEYKVRGIWMMGYDANGYVCTGIEASLTENRGKLILIVDETMATPLATELGRLKMDLIGDGWQVIRHDVSRTASLESVKALIQADYAADPINVKSVFLFGHIPIFMSGNMHPDGHSGIPWAADGYFGDVDGEWTPLVTVEWPSTLELQVGRVDLWNITLQGLNETELLRRYLNKDHNYRHKLFNVQYKALLDDTFDTFGTPFALTTFSGAPPIVGRENIEEIDWKTPAVTANPYLLAQGTGPGNYVTECVGVVKASDMTTVDPAVFTFLIGSYFGQWNNQDVLIRQAIATPNHGLTCGWAGFPTWFIHHLGFGEPIGYSSRATQNNRRIDQYSTRNIYENRSLCSMLIHTSLMGDPTLRAFMIAPATNLASVVDDLGDVDLSWTASTDTVLGYNVYRATQADGPYSRVNSEIITGTTYHDAAAPPGAIHYMVRPVRLETTPSGTFYNAGQGTFTWHSVPDINIPTDGLKLWVHAGKNVTTDSGGHVSLWESNTELNDLAQASENLKPLFVDSSMDGKPAIGFDGSDDVLSTSGLVLNGASSFTVVAVAKPGVVVPGDTLLWHGDSSPGGGYGFRVGSDGKLKAGWTGGVSEVSSSDSIISGKWFMAGGSYDGAAHKLWVNGSLAGSVAPPASNFIAGVMSAGNLGASTNGWNGDIAEVFVYNRVLSDTERADLTHYIKGKYFRPIGSFTATPDEGLAPVAIMFDASSSYDCDGSIASYAWNYGDGATGSGVSATHTYSSPGQYTVTLTLTDSEGYTTATSRVVKACPGLSSVSVVGNPVAPVTPHTPVTLSATPVGGYRVLYRFQINSGSGWLTLRDFEENNACSWTPTLTGDYELRVQARSTGSTADYDVESPVLNYLVYDYPFPSSGLKLWLRADAGVTLDDTGKVSGWSDLSGAGNSISQDDPALRPSLVANVLQGKPAIRFASAGQILRNNARILSGTTPFTTFTAAKFNSVPTGLWQYLWWNGLSTPTEGYGFYISTTYKLRSGWGNQSYYVGDSNVVLAGHWYRACSRYTPGAHQVWLNGVSRGSSAKSDSNFTGGFFSVGNFGPDTNNRGFFGDIGEILIYDRALTDEERAGVESYLASRWSPSPLDSLKDAAERPDTTNVSITGTKVVTAASGVFSGGVYYIAEPARTFGLKIVGGPAASLWENLSLTGVMATDSNGERFLNVASIDSRVPGSEIGTLGMANNYCSATGQLVRVWGRVTETGTGYFIVDDGSGAPVRVETSGLVTPITVSVESGFHCSATGIAGKGTGGVVVVRPRANSDIRVY
jgi:hypothetical protein